MTTEVATTPELPVAENQPGKNSPKRSQCGQHQRVESGDMKPGTARFVRVLWNQRTREVKNHGGDNQSNWEMRGATMHFHPEGIIHKALLVTVGSAGVSPALPCCYEAKGESTTASVLFART